MVLDRHVLAFDVAGFVKTFAEGGHKMRDDIGRPDVDEPDHWLPSARRERPRRRRAAEQREELAALHSITSSASASNLSGISRPRALAVFRLTPSSNLVGCRAGKSGAFAPLRIRPA